METIFGTFATIITMILQLYDYIVKLHIQPMHPILDLHIYRSLVYPINNDLRSRTF
jgi:hypothetical protein